MTDLYWIGVALSAGFWFSWVVHALKKEEEDFTWAAALLVIFMSASSWFGVGVGLAGAALEIADRDV